MSRIRGVDSLSRLITEPSHWSLAATENVSVQSIAAEETADGLWGSTRWLGLAVQGRLQQRPASTDPVAVAAINELIGTTREATLWSVLTSGEP